MTLATYGRGRSPKFPGGKKQLGEHFGSAFIKNRFFIMGVKHEMFGQFMQLPLAGMPLQGIVPIAQASREVNIEDAASGCQVAGNFGVDFPFDVKDDRASLPIDNLAKLRSRFAAAGGTELDHVAKFPAFLRWQDSVYLTILPFSDMQMIAVKLSDFQVVEFMLVG